jgi:hypothetical protein
MSSPNYDIFSCIGVKNCEWQNPKSSRLGCVFRQNQTCSSSSASKAGRLCHTDNYGIAHPKFLKNRPKSYNFFPIDDHLGHLVRLKIGSFDDPGFEARKVSAVFPSRLQWRFADNKLRVDLFDRRYKIYEATRKFLVRMLGETRFDQLHFFAFHADTADPMCVLPNGHLIVEGCLRWPSLATKFPRSSR